MNNISLTKVGLKVLTLPKCKMPTIGNIADGGVHHLHYLLADGGHYVTKDGEFYQCKE